MSLKVSEGGHTFMNRLLQDPSGLQNFYFIVCINYRINTENFNHTLDNDNRHKQGVVAENAIASIF